MAIARPASLHQAIDVPADRLALLVGSLRSPAILESGPGFGPSGRWSLYAAEPRLHFTARDRGWELRGDGWDRSAESDPLEALDALLLREFGLADPSEIPDPEAPPFQGGLIGFFGYDLAPRLEWLPRKAAADSRLPDIHFGLYDTAVTVDHRTGAVVLSAYDLLREGPRALKARIDSWSDALSAPAPPPPRTALTTPIAGNFARADYLDAVGRALEYIRAGDIFQVNLSQHFEARGRVEPLDLYLRLKAISPAPFAAFLRRGDLAVVGASPEWFYQTRGDLLVTRPIKGTRPRGRSPADDERLAAELRASAKDRAELTMIVDLERNDLGRVCRFGTVRVREPLAVESFAQVHHLVATVEGRLRPGAGPIDVVRALFPGGSITGAPKIRAMEIIDELEPTRRGLYTGAVGYFSRGGASAFNIAIRTFLVEGPRVSFQVGGGIVADSDPEAEYEETLHKGRGLRAVLEGQGRAP
jgi:para-aminobenzoate synthetase component I